MNQTSINQTNISNISNWIEYVHEHWDDSNESFHLKQSDDCKNNLMLGVSYHRGLVHTKDLDQAEQCYRHFINETSDETIQSYALNLLALLKIERKPYEEDDIKSCVELLESSSKYGNEYALINLGILFMNQKNGFKKFNA